MKKFTYTEKSDWERMAVALEVGEANQDGSFTTRKDVAESIAKMLDSCFEFGLNPLPRLRKLFPRFNWEYHDIIELPEADKDRAIRKVVSNSDIFWEIEFSLNGAFVTATLIDNPKTALAIYGNRTFEKVSEDPSCPSHVDWLVSLGAQDIGS
ncbi:MAG: hypothetical protein WCO16_01890 [bacterium]